MVRHRSESQLESSLQILKIIPNCILTYAGMKTGFSRVDVGLETGFRAGVGQNADWSHL